MQMFPCKSKNIFLIIAAAVCCFCLIGNDFADLTRLIISGAKGVGFLRYFINTAVITLVNLSAALSVLIYFCFAKKGGRWTAYVLPLGFGLKMLTVFGLAFGSGSLLTGSLFGTLYYLLLMVQGISVVAMFIGTLKNGALAPCLKWGALSFLAAAVVLGLIKFIHYVPYMGVLQYVTSFAPSSVSVFATNLFYFALFLAIAPAKKANFK